ncbi:MAG: glycoside hydrolase family 95 protein [Bacteroidota bacterium]
MNNFALFSLLFLLCLFGCKTVEIDKQTVAKSSNPYLLTYDRPATFFEETLVMGNGKMGASIFSGVAVDSIYLNDATLWSGEPVDPYMNPKAYEYLPKVRAALANEDYQAADSLITNIQGSFSQSYAPLGTMHLEFDHPQGAFQNYQRRLNISDATAKVSYEIGQTQFQREYFVSHPDKVMVIRLQSSQPKQLNFSFHFSSKLRYTVKTRDATLNIDGYAPYRCKPVYMTQVEQPVQFDENRGIHFGKRTKVHKTDGEIVETVDKISVKDASFAEILIAIETSFNGFDKDPVKEGKPYQTLVQEQLTKATNKSLATLRANHTEDYHNLFNRLSLTLQTQDTLAYMPTDKRLIRYSEGLSDKGLEELYFHFGRYLLIVSSRTPEVPANLQGIWNQHIRPPWSSNYTTNINVEENYWLAEVANLSECHYPLLSFIENLAQTGEISAKTFYGADGWTVGHNSDIWAMTNPVGDFGKGWPVWANWNMGGAWLSTHLWEHYQFTQNRPFLQNKAYPLLKGAAEFCLDMLIQDKQGNWVTSPGTSPENLYKTPDGYKGAVLYGATSDLAFIRELFDVTIKAATILNIDQDFRQELKDKLANLHPYQVSKKGGHLQEWYYDWEDVDPKHRHQTHLYGLHPGHHISVDRTPELANACRVTLNVKGDKSTGWSQGWRVNLWARLKDGNRAHQLYRQLLNYVQPSEKINYFAKGGTYPNLLDAHPPFQIDGNFGGAAGVIEMLVQSSEESITLLPAIPDEWSSGSISGVKARGGYELSFKWNDKKVSDLAIFSENGGQTTIRANGSELEVLLAKNERLEVALD